MQVMMPFLDRYSPDTNNAGRVLRPITGSANPLRQATELHLLRGPFRTFSKSDFVPRESLHGTQW